MSSVTATVTLGPPLATAISAEMQSEVAAELAKAIGELGLDRSVTVVLRASDGDGPAGSIALSIDDVPCRFPQAVLWEALAYVDASATVPWDQEAFLDRLERDDPAVGRRQARIVAYVCRAALIRQPTVLLRGQPPAAHALADMWMPVPSAEDAEHPVEDLIAARAAPEIELLVEPQYLRDLTMDASDSEIFPYAREGLFTELGVPVPPLTIRPDPSLNPGGFAIRINAVRTPPRIGLPPGFALVNDTLEGLTLWKAEAEASLNPSSRQPGSIVAVDEVTHLEFLGLTTWGPLQYLVLAIAADIRQAAHALLTAPAMETLLQRVAVRAPIVVARARDNVPVHQLAPLLRTLLRDQVSIRNLRRILELLLRRATLERRPWDTADAVAYVRTGLADQITARVVRSTQTAVVYLLDPQLERSLAQPADDAAEQLAAAVRAERAYLPRTALVPALLTQGALAAPVRAMLRAEFPDQTVIAYPELPPEINVQPVARLSAP